ncbi:hypothetical protein BJ165DRAFT_1532198 [Panaeolus papilionaceus]|nr:hypothetical protein BJ165DRAFT_1532198 [Panaeolus papilionaceus]
MRWDKRETTVDDGLAKKLDTIEGDGVIGLIDEGVAGTRFTGTASMPGAPSSKRLSERRRDSALVDNISSMTLASYGRNTGKRVHPPEPTHLLSLENPRTVALPNPSPDAMLADDTTLEPVPTPSNTLTSAPNVEPWSRWLRLDMSLSPADKPSRSPLSRSDAPKFLPPVPSVPDNESRNNTALSTISNNPHLSPLVTQINATALGGFTYGGSDHDFERSDLFFPTVVEVERVEGGDSKNVIKAGNAVHPTIRRGTAGNEES